VEHLDSEQPWASAAVMEDFAEIRDSAAGSDCRSCAATATAIAAGHLLAMPSMPIGQLSRSIWSAAKPS
jgi:bacterioferritin-associated ferredoxin